MEFSRRANRLYLMSPANGDSVSAGKALHPESDGLFRALVDAIPQLAWMAEGDGHIFWYNRRWYEYTGATPEQMEGWGWQSVHHSDSLSCVLERWKTSIATGEPFEMEFPLRGAEGRFRWFLTRVTPVRDATGAVVKWYGTNTDIEEYRIARINAQFLASVSSDLNRYTEIETIMATVGAKMGEHFDVTHIAFVDINQEEAISKVTHEWRQDDAITLIGTYRLWDYLSEDFLTALQAGETFVVNDTRTDPRADDEMYAGLGIRSFVCVPLVHNGTWRFQLNIHDSRPRDWTESEIELLRELASRIFLRIDRAKAGEALRKEFANTERLRSISVRELSESGSDEASLYDDILDAAIQFMSADTGSLQFLDPETNELVIHAGRGLPDSFLPRFERIGNDIGTSCSIALATGARAFVDYSDATAYDHDMSAEVHREAGILSALSTPLLSRSGDVMGMITTHWRRRITPQEKELSALDVVARQAADLVERQRTRKQISDTLERSQQQSRIFDTTLSSISDFAYIFDAQGRFRYSNKPLLDLLHISLDEIIGKNFFDLNYPDALAARLQEQIQHVFDTQEIVTDETPFTGPDGSPGYYEYIFRPVIAADGSVEFVAGSTRDVTERRRKAGELQEARDQLEIKVAERTAELAEALTQLRIRMEEQAVLKIERIAVLERLFTIQEDERGRIARDLHDQLGQSITALRLQITGLKKLTPEDENWRDHLARAEAIAGKLDSEISLTAWQLRPSFLDSTHFLAALEQYITEWSNFCGIGAEIKCDGLREADLTPEIRSNLYRILQEALNNAAKHSKASRITVMFHKRNGSFSMIIEDNGIGFNVEKVTEKKTLDKGFGLAGMQDRAALVGGEIEIESAKSKGTTLFVRIPLND